MTLLKICLLILLILLSITLLENNKVYGGAVCPGVTIWNGTACTKKIIEIEQVPIEPDPITSQGIGRNSNLFKIYCKGQELLAIQYFNSTEIQKELPPSFTIYEIRTKRVDNPILQAEIVKEIHGSNIFFYKNFGSFNNW